MDTPKTAEERANRALARREKRSRDVVASPAANDDAMLQMIERIIRDPSIDLDRVKAVIGMKKEIDMEANKRLWTAAMSKAQAEMRAVVVDRDNSQTRSKYASYAAIDKAIRPIYTKYGFSLVFDTADSPLSDHIRVVCDVSCAGYTRQFHRDMPADGKGAKGGDVMTKTHASGSAGTYGQRYLVIGIFNLAITLVADRDDDDDGNAAGNADEGSINKEQYEKLFQAMTATKTDLDKFLTFLSSRLKREILSLDDIPASKFGEVMECLEIKAKAGAKR